MQIIIKAIEEKEADRLYLLWVELFRYLDNKASFDEWRERLNQASRTDTRKSEDIVKEIMEVHGGII